VAEAERKDRERGAGLLSTSFGVGVFLVFVLFAVQLLINLYATSVVTSVAYDAARRVAVSGSHPPTPEEEQAAVDHARAQLGRYGADATFEWRNDDPGVVKLHVRVVNPRLLGPGVDQLVGLDVIDRTVVVRVESKQ
jgi:Flp pilus assembly protein TadG